ncbi:histidine phosphatase family protein [Candidatus Pelagibacter sp.]|uniref:histidine phosphatase family protein n=1 Tax=Candidatus Pelagibacter sp. TaxID=2024849 RepID=UPI003F857E5C
MKFLRFFIIIFISLTTPIKADLYKNLINQLEDGGKLIFIRHAYAPGNGDPADFNLNDCSTQRNLSDDGRKQAQRIGEFFTKNKIEIDKVLSSEWCRCKETAKIAFKNYSTNSFLNSFYSSKFSKNKDKQVKAFNYYIKNLESKKNLIFVTHYVFISEVLNYGPSSGEIVVSDKNLNIIGSIEINF